MRYVGDLMLLGIATAMVTRRMRFASPTNLAVKVPDRANALRPVAASLPLGNARAVIPRESSDVDPAAMNCDCADFVHRRHFDNLDLRRLCIHLQRAVLKHHREQLPAVFVALLEDQQLTEYRTIYIRRICAHDVAFAQADGGDEIAIFTRQSKLLDPHRRTGRYHRYALSLGDGSWKNGSMPADAAVLLESAQRLF